jgi:uncharacterized protein (DUF3084 family)
MRYITILFIFIAFGCTDEKKISELEAEKSRLESQLELVTEQSHLKDTYVEEYTKTVNEVYDYLERIRKREGLLMRYSRELEENSNIKLKDKIFTNLTTIDQYLKNSRNEIKRLKGKMGDSQFKFASLEKTIDNLTALVDKKEAEIAQLSEQLSTLNERIAETEQKLAQKSSLADEQKRRLNKGYYIIGDNSELREKNIITKRGGILGLGRTTTLSEQFDQSYFVETDITVTDSITIPAHAKSVRIVSPHNPDSYHIVAADEDRALLEIIDPDEFWKMKYLVILAKN